MRLSILFLFLLGCQTKPTVITQESANHDDKTVVLVDTRQSVEYAGFHVAGSVNLNSSDFLILKNPRIAKRILDPDIPQLIERLAKRGVSPSRSVVLLSNQKDSDENKKWNWLLLQLNVKDVIMMSLADYRKANPNRVPQAPPSSVSVWSVLSQQYILKKADQCFVNWSDEACL